MFKLEMTPFQGDTVTSLHHTDKSALAHIVGEMSDYDELIPLGASKTPDEMIVTHFRIAHDDADPNWCTEATDVLVTQVNTGMYEIQGWNGHGDCFAQSDHATITGAYESLSHMLGFDDLNSGLVTYVRAVKFPNDPTVVHAVEARFTEDDTACTFVIRTRAGITTEQEWIDWNNFQPFVGEREVACTVDCPMCHGDGARLVGNGYVTHANRPAN